MPQHKRIKVKSPVPKLQARINELINEIVSLRVDLLAAELPEGYCLPRCCGLPVLKEIVCNETDCDDCRREYLEAYAEHVRKEYKNV